MCKLQVSGTNLKGIYDVELTYPELTIRAPAAGRFSVATLLPKGSKIEGWKAGGVLLGCKLDGINSTMGFWNQTQAVGLM